MRHLLKSMQWVLANEPGTERNQVEVNLRAWFIDDFKGFMTRLTVLTEQRTKLISEKRKAKVTKDWDGRGSCPTCGNTPLEDLTTDEGERRCIEVAERLIGHRESQEE